MDAERRYGDGSTTTERPGTCERETSTPADHRHRRGDCGRSVLVVRRRGHHRDRTTRSGLSDRGRDVSAGHPGTHHPGADHHDRPGRGTHDRTAQRVRRPGRRVRPGGRRRPVPPGVDVRGRRSARLLALRLPRALRRCGPDTGRRSARRNGSLPGRGAPLLVSRAEGAGCVGCGDPARAPDDRRRAVDVGRPTRRAQRVRRGAPRRRQRMRRGIRQRPDPDRQHGVALLSTVMARRRLLPVAPRDPALRTRRRHHAGRTGRPVRRRFVERCADEAGRHVVHHPAGRDRQRPPRDLRRAARQLAHPLQPVPRQRPGA